MGLNRIKEKEQEIQRKSVIVRKKEEEKKLKELQAQFMKVEQSSSSSEEEKEDPKTFGDYFMFRRKKEIKLMQSQFSILLQNRREKI